MNRNLTAALLVAAAVLTNVAFTALGTRLQLPGRPEGAGRRHPRRVPRIAGRRHRLVHRDGRCPPRCSRRSPSASAGYPTTGDAGRGPGRHRRRRRPGRRPGALAAAGSRLRRRRRQRRPGRRRRGARLVRDRTPGARQPHRRDLRLPAHRRLDAAGAAALGRTLAGRWFTALGARVRGADPRRRPVAAGLPGVDLANFVGYVLWSVWLVAFAVLLLRRPAADRTPAGAVAR